MASQCNCGFDIGDPRVPRHSKQCSQKVVDELKEDLRQMTEAYEWQWRLSDELLRKIEDLTHEH